MNLGKRVFQTTILNKDFHAWEPLINVVGPEISPRAILEFYRDEQDQRSR